MKLWSSLKHFDSAPSWPDRAAGAGALTSIAMGSEPHPITLISSPWRHPAVLPTPPIPPVNETSQRPIASALPAPVPASEARHVLPQFARPRRKVRWKDGRRVRRRVGARRRLPQTSALMLGCRHPHIKARNSYVDETLFGRPRPSSSSKSGSASPTKPGIAPGRCGGSASSSPCCSPGRPAASSGAASPGKAGSVVLTKAQLDRMLQVGGPAGRVVATSSALGFTCWLMCSGESCCEPIGCSEQPMHTQPALAALPPAPAAGRRSRPS